MWFKTIFRPKSRSTSRTARVNQAAASEPPLFDETFLRRLERMSLQAQRSLRGNPVSGEHASRRLTPTSIFSEHRPYTSGDDLRYVDWNAYARHNHMLLKQGEAEQDVHVHLIVDTSRSMAWGQPSKLRAAQRLAGALGYLALAHSDRLHVTPLAGGPQRPFGPAQGKGRLVEFLRFLGDLQPAGETDLGGTLTRLARQHPQGGIVVLCSDLLASAGLTEGLRQLAPPRWQVLVLHLFDPQEFRPTFDGPLELIDSESGRTLQMTVNQEQLLAYRQRLSTWRDELSRSCQRAGARYIPLLTTWPIEQKVVPYLRARRLLT